MRIENWVVASPLGIELTELVFNNKQVDTDGAAALGVTVHRYTGVEALLLVLAT